MKIILTSCLLAAFTLPTKAQIRLSLDSCRQMALRNNKQLAVAKKKEDIAANTLKAARTKYLPKVDALGGYELVSKEISILNDDQKNALNNLGTQLTTQMAGRLPQTLTSLAQQGLMTPQQVQAAGAIAPQLMQPLAEALNNAGGNIRKAFRTNNRNMMGGAILVSQPIYMGGAITAANRMAEIGNQMAHNATDGSIQNTIYAVDQTYWLVVSLNQKNKLAKSFLELLRKLDDDVQKLIREGFATKADGLKVSVKVNEAEMAVTQAEDGLTLARMALCQQCGLPMETEIVLEDECRDVLPDTQPLEVADVETAWENRPELRLLQNSVELAEQTTKLTRATYLPQVAATGGYAITNPNVYNGFEKKFSGIWNIGILVRIPIWHWQEGSYKVRAAKAAANIASMELEEAREMVELQVNQNKFKVKEANKKYSMSLKNVEKADENLRCANLGFAEGVMTATEVMEAQTAWMQAQTQKIDAEIDLRLTQVGLKKSLGLLN